MTSLPRRHQRRRVRRRHRRPAPPETYRAAVVRRDEQSRCSPASRPREKDPRKSLHVEEVAVPELAPDEAYVAVMASAINFNTVWTSIFEPLPTFGFLRAAGQGERLGQAPRPALPRGRLRRRRRGAAGRLGRAQLEAGRPGHRPLQLRRRPGPVRPRRLDAGRQPAHLGLRVQLRRPGRPGGGQGQPADAQAGPPHLGGGGGQRAVQLDLLPHARLPQRGPHEAGRRGPDLGRHRRPRRLRRPVRAQRRRHPRRRGLSAGQGRRCSTSSGCEAVIDRKAGRLPVLVRRAHPGRVGVAPVRQGHPGAGRRGPRHRLRAPGPPDHGRVGVRRAPAAARSSPARRPAAT